MTHQQKHAVADANTPASSQEGYNAPFGVNISFPEAVVIKMVDATALDDYEMLLFFSALFFSAFVGFVIAAVQAADPKPWGIMSAVLFVAAAGSFTWALRKRSTMKAKSKEFKIRTSGIDEIKSPSPSSVGTP